MRRYLIWSVLIFICVGTVMAQPKHSDEQTIRQMVADAIRRLNAGDMTAIHDFWDEEADYVTVDGRMLRGRVALEQFFSQMLSAATRPTQTATIERVRFIAPDVAIVDGSWIITGARDPSGKELPPIQGRGMEVVKKTGSEWRFIATREMVIWKP